MNASKSGLFTLVFAAVLSACGPSTPNANELSTEVALAIQQTAEAAAPTPAPTSTSLPTATATATEKAVPPTDTPAPTLTPTPDTRVIIGDPEDYILQREDIPDEYYLKPNGSTPHLNSEILAARPLEEAKAYLEATGRIGGWIIRYWRSSSITIAPEWIRSYVVMYQTAKGPELAMDPEWNDDVYDRVKSGELEMLDPIPDLGDASLVYQSRERQSSGKYYVIYTVEFRYRNIWTDVEAAGMESDVRPEYVEKLARLVFEKLKEAPLAEEMQ